MAGFIKQFRFVMPTANTAWTKLKANREKLGASMSATQATLAAVSNSFAQAQADKISGLANLAAQTGLDRINKARKAQSASMIKQIDSVQSSIDKAKIAEQLKQKYYVYTLPAVIVDTSTPEPTVDTEA